jgi:HK97 family phage prohead protease
MLLREVFATSAELKFVGEPGAGQIEGHAAVFGNMDSKGDMIMPEAFDATLAEHKANGTMPFMYAEHSAYMGGDPLPIGKWTEMHTDATGLRVKGHLIALSHPDVARTFELMKAGVMGGISIAWAGRDGGIVRGTKAGEPKRYLKSIDVFSADPVCDPANRLARLDSVKAMMSMPNTQAATESIVAAHSMCTDCLAGGNAPTRDQRSQILQHLQDGHRALTGQDIPAAVKMAFDELRELKKWLHRSRDEGGRGFSNSQADEIAELVFKSMPRDESGDQAAAAARKEAVGQIRSLLTGFSLKPTGE